MTQQAGSTVEITVTARLYCSQMGGRRKVPDFSISKTMKVSVEKYGDFLLRGWLEITPERWVEMERDKSSLMTRTFCCTAQFDLGRASGGHMYSDTQAKADLEDLLTNSWTASDEVRAQYGWLIESSV